MIRHESGPDQQLVWHYGNPFGEQHTLAAGQANVDLSNRPVFTVSGTDRMEWLTALSTVKLSDLSSGRPVRSFILDAPGRIVSTFVGVDNGQFFIAHTEPGHLPDLLTYLRRNQRDANVDLVDRNEELAVIWRGRSRTYEVVERPDLDEELGELRAGTWAWDALRIAAGRPRIFVDTDDLCTLGELGELGEPGGLGTSDQFGSLATVAGGPGRRRLTLLQLDGSRSELPRVGDVVSCRGRPVGRVGSSSRHWESGPIALALIDRSTSIDEPVSIGRIAALQETIGFQDV